MKIRILILAVFMLTSFSIMALAADYTVGISPNFIDLGEVERGSSHLASFRVVTPSKEPILVYLDKSETHISSINPVPNNFSEEPCSSWADFIKNPVQIEPSGQPRSFSQVDMIVHIPADAEPGMHRIVVKPSVYIPDEASGVVGSAVVGVTTFTLSFFVKGDAVRSGTVLDSVKTGYSDERIEISTSFQNTGTVSVVASISQKIAGKTFNSSSALVMPQELKVFRTYLPLEGLEKGGVYPIETQALYTTGMATLKSSLEITEEIPAGIQQPAAGFSWLLIVAVFLVSGGIAYWYTKRV